MIDELLAVTRDALLEGRTADAERVASELARALGAAGAGVDEHGLWLRVAVGSADLRMRWIGPGSLTADGRRVRLTTGRWFAERVVTRALYATLMDVPLQGPPDAAQVGVSWSEARQLCRRLAVAVPALRPRLPSAVEWAWTLHSDAPGVVMPGSEHAWCEDAVSDADGELWAHDVDPLGDRGEHRALMAVEEDDAAWWPAWGRGKKAAIRVAGGPPLARGAPLEVIAAALGVASEADLLPKEEVVAWVVGRIADTERPDPLLIRASTGVDPAGALLRFGEANGIETSDVAVGRLVLGEWLHACEIGRWVVGDGWFISRLLDRLFDYLDLHHPELVDSQGVSLPDLGYAGLVVPWLREVAR